MAMIPVAERYRENAFLPSHKFVTRMLIDQIDFPIREYNEGLDTRLEWTSTDLQKIHGKNHFDLCCNRHGVGSIEKWPLNVHSEQVMAFLKDLLWVPASVEWTGYRITGTTNPQNHEEPIWIFELFAKHPRSATKVCSSGDVKLFNPPQQSTGFLVPFTK